MWSKFSHMSKAIFTIAYTMITLYRFGDKSRCNPDLV